MPVCSVKGCKNRYENVKEKKIRFFSFPKDEDTAAKWIKACGKSVNLKSARVCSIHFALNCYKEIPEHLKCLGDNYAKGIRTLLPNAVPTENLIFEEARGVLREVNVYRKNAEIIAKTIVNSNISRDNAENINTENVCTHIEVSNDQNCKSMNISTSVNNIINENVSVSDKNEVTKDCENLFVSVSDSNKITLSNVEHSFNMAGCSESQSIVQDHHETVRCQEKLKDEELAKKNKEINALKIKLKRLEKRTNITIKKKVNEVLKNVFTPKQIERIMYPNKKRVKWNIEDISSAISLRSVSPKAYRYLRKNKYSLRPLPGLSTLRKWATRLNLDEDCDVTLVDFSDLNNPMKQIALENPEMSMSMKKTIIFSKICRINIWFQQISMILILIEVFLFTMLKILMLPNIDATEKDGHYPIHDRCKREYFTGASMV
ncbi:uncharacterized protein [Temnothorax longispinosus]|uniref:uncharacterized protein n=1 Tax=Temnothorax longispinosus TaxID=300112 RepID=UPI003A9A5488